MNQNTGFSQSNNYNVNFYSNNENKAKDSLCSERNITGHFFLFILNDCSLSLLKDYRPNNKIHSGKAIWVSLPFSKQMKFNFLFRFRQIIDNFQNISRYHFFNLHRIWILKHKYPFTNHFFTQLKYIDNKIA